MQFSSHVLLDRKMLPVLAEGDVLVIGGSFGGAAAALAAAENGQRVILVEPRTYLGREVTACLRPWAALAQDDPMPELLRSCAAAAGVYFPQAGLLAFQMAELKTHLEDRLLAAGVKILYASLPVGLVVADGRIRGVVIANKSGRQVVRAATVIDATESGLLVRMAHNELQTPLPENQPQTGKTALFLRTLEFDRVTAASYGTLAVPETCQMDSGQVRLIPGARGEAHCLVECPMQLDAAIDDALGLTRREIKARRRTMALAACLRKQVPGFEKAYLAHASQLLTGPVLPFLHTPAGASHPAESPALRLGCGLPDLPLANVTGPLPGLLRIPDDVCLSIAGIDRAVLASAAVGQAVGQALDRLRAAQSEPPGRAAQPATSATAGLAPLVVNEPHSPQRGRVYPQQPVRPASVPIMRTVDVLVIGGGTSGAAAAYAAARAGAATLLVEAAPGLGGTGTFGGVHSYWFGRRVGFAREIIEAVEQMHAELGLEPPEGELLKWNIEAKMHSLLRRAEQAGVEMLWGALAFGALLQGQQVRGVLAATPLGPLALCAGVVIDATGDGDIAYFAGAQVVYGAQRDHVTMWYSMAQFYRPGVTRNNFTSMLDVGNVEDYTRAILAGRRRVTGHDQGSYVAPRESRHVLADVVLTLNDQLLKRCWPDTVYVAFSNHDIKGHSSSDWLRVGLIPPNLEIEIPYRALLPKGFDGLLVAGKAFSATHDALPAVRMQPDLENLGGVTGLAAALAVKAGCTPRQVSVRALQEALVAAGVLPERILHRTLATFSHTQESLEMLAHQLMDAKPLHAYQDMELDAVFHGRIPFVDLACAGPQALPVLQAALEQSHAAQRTLIAKALAMLGSPAAVPALIAALHDAAPGEGLQPRQAHVRGVQLPPDQGAMPEAAHLLYALGMTNDERALPIWDHFRSLIAEASAGDIRDRNLGLFYYVDAVCYGAERLGDARAVPFLRRMAANPIFSGRSVTAGFEPDFFLERQAYLEIVIARALARCGDRRGFETLITYLTDARALLAEHAHSELQSITGEDFGKEREAWFNWLDATGRWRAPHSCQAAPLPH